MTAAARDLASARQASVIAPAGCGKTELIASALAHAPPRQLVLTHTNAGTQVLRQRFARLGVTSRSPEVETIASFALRLATSYPRLAGVHVGQPRSTAEWRSVYQGAARLLRMRVGRHVLAASYSGVFVDEYQDCSLPQHDIVLALAEALPCRVLGDPLQAIFGFRDEPSVDWKRDVEPPFEPVSVPRFPWRWHRSNRALGAWLLSVRAQLEAGAPIGLKGAPVTWIEARQGDRTGEAARKACFRFKGSAETVVAIHGWAPQCHRLAGQLGGAFTSIEPIDAAELFEHAARIHNATGDRRALALVGFVKLCATKVGSELASICAAFEAGRARKARTTKHAPVLQALLAVAEDDGLGPLLPAIRAMVAMEGASVSRRELLVAMQTAIREFDPQKHADLAAAAWEVRQRTSIVGRIPFRRVVARTLLVKGLEYDHGIVLDAAGLSPHHLYVALTRASRTLTVLSAAPLLHPVRDAGMPDGASAKDNVGTKESA